MDIHQQLLNNCEWLFGQEVRVITFVDRDSWHGFIVPNTLSLRPLAQQDISGLILVKTSTTRSGVFYGHCNVSAIYQSLYMQVGEMLGRVLQADSNKLYHVDISAIPAGPNIVVDVPVLAEAVGHRTVLDNPQMATVTKKYTETEAGEAQAESVETD